MYFGPETDEPVARRHKSRKKTLLIASVVAVAIAILFSLWLFLIHPDIPVPASIRQKAAFEIIYPSGKTARADSSSFNYQQSQQSLSFTVRAFDSDIIFTEQPAPENAGTGEGVYYPALGLHPYAQFQSKLGPVALARFYESKTLKPRGQSAVLISRGTLLIAHTDRNLSNNQWKQLFESLKITK